MGLEFSHCLCDGMGAAQFLNALGESARGLQFPTIPPAWSREALPAPLPADMTVQPPRPPPPPIEGSEGPMELANIDISPEFIAILKRQFLELTGKPCSTFEALAARVWICRVQAITHNNSSATANKNLNGENTTLFFFSNTRRLVDPPLPTGFYGNCIFPVTISLPLERLKCANQVEAVKLIQEAKAKLPNQFTEWMARTKRHDHDHDGNDDGYVDPFAPSPDLSSDMLFAAEWGRLGFGDVDYGWGPPVHLVPVNYSSTMPLFVMAFPPSPRKGVRLVTWCVDRSHLSTFRQLLMDQP